MKKGLFEYCQKHLRVCGKFKASSSFEKLACLGIGCIESGWFYFNEKDKQQLIELVASEHDGIHLYRDSYPLQKTRDEKAITQRDEKGGALKVSEDFVLLNSLNNFRINQQITSISELTSLGQYVCATDINTIEHQQIVLVENLVVMANLKRLNIPESLSEALWVYRGDLQVQQQTGTAYSFFRRFKDSHQLICFSDLDPSGIQISLTSGATQWLTIADGLDLNIELKGPEQEWFKQQKAICYLNNQQLPTYCASLFMKMKASQITLKQEHMLAHSLKLCLSPLTS
ncbi:hypothetical protein GCM10007916_26070 [Psychromonas marina]|uniref:DUF7281 domain-containing protein n=1 Tax=Psychromonas marina TaxID=88364 RepID=A0ABQ6E2V4_9GAMM|nr:hypothetical protein [Psychromonas marina]GLS91538.1 hypothetical protein GCM10007916_26070 [Psychromonas marina]